MLTVYLVLAALAVARASSPPFRKSLSFGPSLTHATFEQHPPSAFAADPDRDPLVVARDFLASLGHKAIDVARGDESAYLVRPDSYRDANTGVTYVFARQFVNGIEVADGNINVNIKDGKVISYGDSFYRGELTNEALTITELSGEHTHAGYCSMLSEQLAFSSMEESHQHVFSASGAHGVIPSLTDVHRHNCARLSSAGALSALSFDPAMGSRFAALSFIMHATPSEALAEDIQADFAEAVSRIHATPVHHLRPQAGQSPWEETLDGVPDTVAPVKARIAFVQTPSADGTGSQLNLVWKLEVEMADNWYDAAVSAFDPAQIVSVTDWVSDSPWFKPPKDVPTYNIFPWGVNDPSVGERAVVSERPDKLASPIGWHSIPLANDPNYPDDFTAPVPTPVNVLINYTTTFGNNIFTQENWNGRTAWLSNYRPESSTPWPALTFDFPYNPKKSNNSLDEAQTWINATVTQLFYTGNMVHDLYYRYGFDEPSGNFQQHNFDRGGLENDAVIANAQDGSGYNNANFATPPDGTNGRCRMYLWNTATPYRDGDLEAGIVIHELSHGMSTRLTGGPRDSSCLGFGEAGGMGEGWGDFLATVIRSNKNYSDYAMGSWAANQEKGIRNYIYSTNFTINPTTYKTLDKPGYWGVHAIGEVWAEMLWIIEQKLIAKHGYVDSLFPPEPDANGTIPEGGFYRERLTNARGEKTGPLVPAHGNSLAVQLVLNGMKLQPCRPGFFEARDAILQADEVLTGGENFCEIWNGFAERGLGPDATVIGKTPWGGGVRKDDFKPPLRCALPAPEPEDPEDPEDPKEPGKDKDKKKKHKKGKKGKNVLESIMFGDW